MRLALCLAVAFGTSFAIGGECLFHDEYVAAYEQGDLNTYCLTYQRFTETNRWAGPVSAEKIAERRQSPYRDRILEASKRYLESHKSSEEFDDILYDVSRVLAHHGIAQLDSLDVYEILVSRPTSVRLVDLAILGDRRATKFIEVRYRRIRDALSPSYTGEALISLLNALYHIPGDEALRLAQDIAESEDGILRERALRVLERGGT